MKNQKKTIYAIVAAGCAGLVGGCSGSGGSGTASFGVTDAPSCSAQFTRVDVSVIGVSAVGPDGATHTLNLPAPQDVNLLDEVNGASVNLGPITVPAGTYTQVRLLLASNPNGSSATPVNYVTTSSGNTYPLTTPSGQQSGYKVNGDFTVSAGNTVDVTLDFNACRSVVTAGNSGQYLLKPVITATTSSTTGAITGVAAPGDVVFAEDADGIIHKSTVADSAGNFTLSPLEATASGDAGYNVVAVSPQVAAGSTTTAADAPDVVFHVPVTAGQKTVLDGTFPSTTAAGVIDSGTITLASADTDVLVLGQEKVNDPASTTTTPVQDTVTIAESLAQPTAASNNMSSTYTLSYSPSVPEAATYAPSTALAFAPLATTPTVAVNFFGSDGSTATLGTTSQNVTMTPGSDPTYSESN